MRIVLLLIFTFGLTAANAETLKMPTVEGLEGINCYSSIDDSYVESFSISDEIVVLKMRDGSTVSTDLLDNKITPSYYMSRGSINLDESDLNSENSIFMIVVFSLFQDRAEVILSLDGETVQEGKKWTVEDIVDNKVEKSFKCSK